MSVSADQSESPIHLCLNHDVARLLLTLILLSPSNLIKDELEQDLDLLQRVRYQLALMTGAHGVMRDAIRVMIVVFAELKRAMIEETAKQEKSITICTPKDETTELAKKRRRIKTRLVDEDD